MYHRTPPTHIYCPSAPFHASFLTTSAAASPPHNGTSVPIPFADYFISICKPRRRRRSREEWSHCTSRLPIMAFIITRFIYSTQSSVYLPLCTYIVHTYYKVIGLGYTARAYSHSFIYPHISSVLGDAYEYESKCIIYTSCAHWQDEQEKEENDCKSTHTHPVRHSQRNPHKQTWFLLEARGHARLFTNKSQMKWKQIIISCSLDVLFG